MSQYGGGTHYPKRASNNLAIARKIIAMERRKQTYLAPLNPDDNTNENDDKVISSLIGRYKRRTKKLRKTSVKVCFREEIFAQLNVTTPTSFTI
jgi:hypothetical protein